MLYQLEQGPTEQAIFKQSVRYKMPLPDKLKNAPSLNMGLEFYYTAFQRLSTCRNSAMSVGNISYFMCEEYCRLNNIVGDQREDFVFVMLELDNVYLKYLADKKPQTAKPKQEEDPDGESNPVRS